MHLIRLPLVRCLEASNAPNLSLTLLSLSPIPPFPHPTAQAQSAEPVRIAQRGSPPSKHEAPRPAPRQAGTHTANGRASGAQGAAFLVLFPPGGQVGRQYQRSENEGTDLRAARLLGSRYALH